MQNLRKTLFGYYFLFYGSLPMYTIFIPIMLKTKGFSQTKIGLLLSLAPIIAIISMPIWGNITDRAENKNSVLKFIIICATICMLVFGRLDQHMYLFIAYGIFSFFNSSAISLGDTITLECLEKRKGNFGIIRLGGTVGYGVMAIIAGKLADYNQSYVFVAYAILIIGTLITMRKIPKIKGHRRNGQNGSMKDIFKHKNLVIMMIFNLLIFITICFYNSFYSIYYSSLTENKTLLGIAYSIAALSEIPFLLKANDIIKKIGIYKLMISAFLVTSIRWILIGFNHNPYFALALQALHGWGFIVFMYVIVLYTYNNVPKELKTAGQSVAGVLGISGVASIIGNQVGGYLADLTNIHTVFIYSGIFMMITMIFFIISFPKEQTIDEN
ncbi:MFS transporter [Lutibacter sp. B2]|nr:MFS transporter [Lutibacter sp. B2]